MELRLRGSEYQDFLDCRKKWYYRWVENLEPKRPDGKLFFGTLFHKWLEFYSLNKSDKTTADMLTTMWFNEQDVSSMEQFEIDEVLTLARAVADNYHHTYHEQDKDRKVLGTEVKFIVKLEEDLFMEGTIDEIYELPNGKVRFVDHKTVASIQMYVEKSEMDRQISRYWWALKMLSSGIARIWNEERKQYEVWNDFLGKEIDGFDYNLIAKDFPKEPKVLKLKKGQVKPELSKDKSQKTTYDKYLGKIRELGLEEADYTEMLELLKNKPDPFLKRVNVLRTEDELNAAAWEFAYTAGDIHDIKLTIQNNPAAIEPLTYRNIGHHCSTMCGFRSLCKTTIEGGNVSLVKNLGYQKREDVK